MTARKSPTVVHESETQRQYVRVQIPARLRVQDTGGANVTHKVHDLSMGGCSFDPDGHTYRKGQHLGGAMHVSLEGIGITVPMKLVVIRVDADNCAAEFEELTPNATASLRQLISAYLSGEIVNADDVLHTVSRDNFTAPRKSKSTVRTAAGQSRALLGTALSLAVGLVALTYVASELYGLLFVTSSSVAVVEGAYYPVSMPREGTFRPLVAEGDSVEKGAPLATFETPMLEIVRNEALAANLSGERIEQLLENTVKGTVTSPCNCLVQRQLIGDGQFVGKGQPVFALIDQDDEPFVVARFGYKRLNDLKPGRAVSVSVAGRDHALDGEIVRVDRATGVASSDAILEVTVKTTQALPSTFINRPAEVSMMTPDFMPRLGDLKPRAITEAFAEEPQS